MMSIVKVLLRCDYILDYDEYCRLADSLGWSEGTLYTAFAELEKDYIRISKSQYVKREHVMISKEFLNQLKECLSAAVDNSGYLPFGSITEFESFPRSTYEWNGFLLESLIIEFDLGVGIIYPQVHERRVQKGIIVPQGSRYNTFDQLVAALLKENGVLSLPETKLLAFLNAHGLMTSMLPQELFNCESMIYKNEIFTIK